MLRSHVTMTRRVARGVYYVGLACCYGAVLLLILEISARAYTAHVQNVNPLIDAFRRGETPIFDKGTFALIEAEAYYPERLGGWQGAGTVDGHDPGLQQALKWGICEGEDSPQSRQSAFPELSEIAREAYARIHGEMVFEIGRLFRVTNTYGFGRFSLHDSDCIERYLLTGRGISPLLRTAIEEAQHTGAPRVVHVPWDNIDQPDGQLTFTCLPASADHDADVCAYVFLDVHPESLYPDRQEEAMSAHSRWAVESYRFKPHYQGGADNAFITNAFGFRAPDVTLPKPPDMLRILCIGGSTTVEGDTNATTYPALVEEKLRNAFPDWNIEVINAGTNGITSSGHLLRLPDYLALEPDLVVLHVGFNDLYLNYVYESCRLLPHLSRFCRLALPSVFAVRPAAFREMHRAIMGFNLELLTVLFQRQGIAVAFASIAHPAPETLSRQERQYFVYQLHEAWYLPMFSFSRYGEFLAYSNQLLRELSRTYGGIYIPVAERFDGSGAAFVDICHMTQAGVAEKARVVYEALLPVLRAHGMAGVEGLVSPVQVRAMPPDYGKIPGMFRRKAFARLTVARDD